MSKKNLEHLSTEDLLKGRKMFIRILSIVFACIIVYAVAMFYLMLTGNWEARNPFIVLPLFLFVAMILLRRSLTAINEELNRR